MSELGWTLKFRDDDRPWAVWAQPDGGRPFFILVTPYNDSFATAGNGSMLAFLVLDRPAVERAHALAVGCGGTDAGAPGFRPNYHANFYGGYVCDLDGNKLCFCTHGAA